MSNIPSRSPSGVRLDGDDYQHLTTWNEVMLALRPWSEAETITVEALGVGNLDDIVVTYRSQPTAHTQVKHTVDASTPVDTQWMTQPAGKHSLLERFYKSWKQLTQNGVGPHMQLLTDREIDSTDALMRGLDRKSELLVPLAGATTTATATARSVWSAHLDIDDDELLEFLGDLRFRTGRSYAAEHQRAQSLMYGNGFATGDGSIELGISVVRHWVQRRERTLTTHELWELTEQHVGLRQDPGAVLIIEGVDTDLHPEDADELVNFVERYAEDDPDLRRDLSPDDWNDIDADLAAAAGRLRAAGHKRVVVRGAMRLPTWFSAGARLRATHGFSLAAMQHGDLWSSSDAAPATGLCATKPHEINAGSDLAVGVGVAMDPTVGVVKYVESAGLPVARTFIITPSTGVSAEALSGSRAAATMAVAVRDAVRAVLEDNPDSEHIHLFLAVPGALAALLGHRWNALRPTTVYEHRGVGKGYAPAFTLNA